MKSKSFKSYIDEFKKSKFSKFYLLLFVGVLASIAPLLFNQFYTQEVTVEVRIFDEDTEESVSEAMVVVAMGNGNSIMLREQEQGLYTDKIKVKPTSQGKITVSKQGYKPTIKIFKIARDSIKAALAIEKVSNELRKENSINNNFNH